MPGLRILRPSIRMRRSPVST